MKLLPEGYIAVQSTADGVLPDSFRFGETVWAVRPGINIFATAQEAADHAYAAPTEQLPGMPELSGCPTLLFSAGEHLVDGLREPASRRTVPLTARPARRRIRRAGRENPY